MKNSKKRKRNSKAKKVNPKAAKDYTNDPYFVKKREAAAGFLRKAGLPDSFSKQRVK